MLGFCQLPSIGTIEGRKGSMRNREEKREREKRERERKIERERIFFVTLLVKRKEYISIWCYYYLILLHCIWILDIGIEAL